MERKRGNDINEVDGGDDVEDSPDVYVPVHQRRLQKIKRLRTEKRKALGQDDDVADLSPVAPIASAGPKSGVSLLDQSIKTGKVEEEDDEGEMEEKEIVEAVTSFKPLISHQEHARDVIYTETMKMTDWKPPSWTERVPREAWEILRDNLKILVEGDDVPPPLERFEDMKFPPFLLDCLQSAGISKPSPIQIQGIPVALSGRDMIGIAFTGSGKTLVFAVPAFCFALHKEAERSLRPREGPYSVIICPSRELAEQSYDIICRWSEAAVRANFPRVRCMLCIGGTTIRESMKVVEDGGCHVIVATPGRLLHLLSEKKINFELCKLLVLDEADRLIDLGFEEPIRDIMSFFKSQRQTLLFSATMPLKIAQFAKSALVKPVIVNVGRAGAAAMTVRQDVEYGKKEEKHGNIILIFKKKKILSS